MDEVRWKAVARIATAVAIGMAGAGVPASAQAAPTTSVIANAGFETTTGNRFVIPQWHTTGSRGAATVIASAHTGRHALQQRGAAITSQQIRVRDGYYTLTAYARNSGGQRAGYLFADRARTAVPVSASWTVVTIRGVKVSNGRLTVGLRTDGPAGDWIRLDDLRLSAGAPYDFRAGGDITMLNWVQDSGGKYSDEYGRREDPLQILAANGADIVRLRLYNGTGPGHPRIGYPADYLPAGYQNEKDVLDLARRAARYGLKIELTFHYSDYWSNGTIQDIPKDWRDVTALPHGRAVAALEKHVYEYTRDVLKRLKSQGTPPAFVSLGNEIQGGLLFPYGKSSTSDGPPALARFLEAGYRATKEVLPSTQVIIHIDDAGNYDKYRWFFGLLGEYQVPYDVIGSSYYPFWTGRGIPAVAAFFTTVSREFGRKIMVMETGLNWNPVTHDGVEGQLADNGPVPYAETPAGQRDFLYDLFAALKGVPDGAVIGDLYWDPVMIPAPGVGWEVGQPNVVSNTTLFDFGGRALPALAAYRDNVDGSAEERPCRR